MILKIIIGSVAFAFIFYLLSRLQMIAWLHELDNKLNKYLPKVKKEENDNKKNQ